MKDGKQMREDLGIPQLNELRISKCEGYSKGVFQEKFITLNAYSRKERSLISVFNFHLKGLEK